MTWTDDLEAAGIAVPPERGQVSAMLRHLAENSVALMHRCHELNVALNELKEHHDSYDVDAISDAVTSLGSWVGALAQMMKSNIET